jgi:hypothetical protein
MLLKISNIHREIYDREIARESLYYFIAGFLCPILWYVGYHKSKKEKAGEHATRVGAWNLIFFKSFWVCFAIIITILLIIAIILLAVGLSGR